MVYFPKSLVIGAITLLLIFALGLILYVYFGGGADKGIYLRRDSMSLT